MALDTPELVKPKDDDVRHWNVISMRPDLGSNNNNDGTPEPEDPKNPYSGVNWKIDNMKPGPEVQKLTESSQQVIYRAIAEIESLKLKLDDKDNLTENESREIDDLILDIKVKIDQIRDFFHIDIVDYAVATIQLVGFGALVDFIFNSVESIQNKDFKQPSLYDKIFIVYAGAVILGILLQGTKKYWSNEDKPKLDKYFSEFINLEGQIESLKWRINYRKGLVK